MQTINWIRSFFPAVPVPFNKAGRVDQIALQNYAEYMSRQPISGVALWVHTGRGLLLTPKQRENIFKTWREILDGDKRIICGVGAEWEEGISDMEYYQKVMEMGQQAKELGADAVLIYPPTPFSDQKDMEQKIIEYHRMIASLNITMILFYLYKEAGGISYSKEVLIDLFNINEVKAIKMATLDSVCTYQDVSNLLNENFPEISLLTGEDRMFGYTLTRGAIGALVGLGAVSPDIQKSMIDAYFDKNYSDFLDLMYRVDKLAEIIFIQPMEGYIERLLYFLSLQGIIPEKATNDPFGPGITDGERKRIEEVAIKLDLL